VIDIPPHTLQRCAVCASCASVVVLTPCTCRAFFPDLASLETVTSSRQRPPPQWLKQALGVDEDDSDSSKKHRATVWWQRGVVCKGMQYVCSSRSAGVIGVGQVEEECPECKNPRMSFYTMQMRSVDEGQTVFYECLKCGYVFSTNT